ncbi:MAG1140 family protein [Mycoplasmopsis gallopavonis]|uniref:Transmembrane protein n=1 Tax=Mycoplasmopsis gallopavonis TaxID=76629 RepID=A0A449AZX0_9BACT|nr:hypothetical protein [Mycoplasmopsis gallopavonis]RIV16624.1 hypothetical protein D1113_01655 [Mycoplasmopsis gallopavonis]VEU73060.1 Uncharacterised protein [Mycoplasmopsis gallopavonis]
MLKKNQLGYLEFLLLLILFLAFGIFLFCCLNFKFNKFSQALIFREDDELWLRNIELIDLQKTKYDIHFQYNNHFYTSFIKIQEIANERIKIENNQLLEIMSQKNLYNLTIFVKLDQVNFIKLLLTFNN